MRKKHGMSGTRIYNIYQGIKKRCNNNTHKYYKSYGGRGINYDKKWETFEGFFEDMGELYNNNLTIDRIDNNGNYCKSNCRWVTGQEQHYNTNRNINYKGKCIAEWCNELGLNRKTIYARIKRGWTIEDSIKHYLIF